jgi:hypothetical protein
MSLNCPHCGKAVALVVAGSDAKSASRSASPSVEGCASEVFDLLQQIDPEGDYTDFERTFINETTDRYEKWGDRIRMSEKQMNVLRKIAKGGK